MPGGTEKSHTVCRTRRLFGAALGPCDHLAPRKISQEALAGLTRCHTRSGNRQVPTVVVRTSNQTVGLVPAFTVLLKGIGPSFMPLIERLKYLLGQSITTS